MKKLLIFIAFIQLAGCGPSKAEMDAAAAKAVADAQDTSIAPIDESIVNVKYIFQIIKPDGKGGGSIRFINIGDHRYLQWYTDEGVAMCHDESCTNHEPTTQQ